MPANLPQIGNHSVDVDSLLPPPEIARPTPAAEPAKGRLRRFGWQFSLRAFVALQVLIALLLGYVVRRVRSMQRQQVIVRSIIDGERQSVSSGMHFAQPAWLWGPLCKQLNVVPMDVSGVSLGSKPLSTAEAELLRELPYLRTVTLNFGVEEPATMRVLARCPLEWIHLRDTDRRGLSDEKLRPLVHCKSLQVIAIQSVNVTNVGIGDLAALPNVRRLDIQYARMTIDGIKPWIAANRLTDLYLPLRMTSEDCEVAARFSSLWRLSIYELDEHDFEEGVAHLATHPTLQRLEISRGLEGEVMAAVRTLPPRIHVYNYLQQLVSPEDE